MKFYMISVIAVQKKPGFIATDSCLMNGMYMDLAYAQMDAWHIAREKFPESDGWDVQIPVALEVSEKMIRRAYAEIEVSA